jgi:hypothetical protein
MAAIAGLVLASTETARASENYPAELERFWSVPLPACTLCHLTIKGGTGTAKTLFGKSVHEVFHAKGVEDRASLDHALSAMDQGPTDSDGDGVGDHQELFEGSDPNVKDRTKPKPEPEPTEDNGGAAGAAGSDGGSEGGDTGTSPTSGWTPPPPPPASSIPPPLGHGCALASNDAGDSKLLWLLAALAVARSRRLKGRRGSARGA